MKRSKNPTVSRRKLARQALLLAMLGAAAYTAPASAQNPCGPNNKACQDVGFPGCCGGSCVCGPNYCECACC